MGGLRIKTLPFKDDDKAESQLKHLFILAYQAFSQMEKPEIF